MNRATLHASIAAYKRMRVAAMKLARASHGRDERAEWARIARQYNRWVLQERRALRAYMQRRHKWVQTEHDAMAVYLRKHNTTKQGSRA